MKLSKMYEYNLIIRTTLEHTILNLIEDIEDLVLSKRLAYKSRLIEERKIREGKSTKQL